MNKTTLKALKGSIEKWEKIVAGTGLDAGVDNCPLCKKFYWHAECEGCPVNSVTGDGCYGSPYDDWDWLENKLRENASGGYDFRGHPAAKQAARRELKFLKSLLPEGVE